MKKYDLIVVGGGISGTIAAISAARNGMDTLVVEAGGYPGGSLTMNSVAPMMTFHAGDTQVSRGITQEIIDRLISKGESIGHVVDFTKFTPTYTPFDEESMKFELESMLLEAGCTMLYHTRLATVSMDGPRIEHLTVCNKAGLMDLRADYYIDATGDADLTVRSGNPYTKGRSGDGSAQPMTLIVKMVNVDRDELIDFIRAHPENFPSKTLEEVEGMLNTPVLSGSGFVPQMKLAKSRGEMSIPREDILFFESNNRNGEFFFNTTRVTGHDSSDPWSFSDAETIGRKQAQELQAFLRKYIPGFENAWMTLTGPVIGSRSSRQLVGQYTLTEQDVLSQTLFSDSIAFSGYPIDVHSPDGEGTKHEKLPWGGLYGIPYRCVVPQHTPNMLVTGRCVSATFEAQAAIRTTPTVGAIGQAVGLAVSIAAKKKQAVQDVDTDELRRLLVDQGAYVKE
jgi:hypothetical protein